MHAGRQNPLIAFCDVGLYWPNYKFMAPEYPSNSQQIWQAGSRCSTNARTNDLWWENGFFFGGGKTSSSRHVHHFLEEPTFARWRSDEKIVVITLCSLASFNADKDCTRRLTDNTAWLCLVIKSSHLKRVLLLYRVKRPHQNTRYGASSLEVVEEFSEWSIGLPWSPPTHRRSPRTAVIEYFYAWLWLVDKDTSTHCLYWTKMNTPPRGTQAMHSLGTGDVPPARVCFHVQLRGGGGWIHAFHSFCLGRVLFSAATGRQSVSLVPLASVKRPGINWEFLPCCL